jgi:hypothetical protein
MSEHDFDTNGPSEEELRELLRSLPRREAPGDFEPELMRRVAGIRRRRGVLSVLHTGARAEWMGGAVSAAVAAVVVAGGWLFMSSGEPSATTGAPVVATSPAAVVSPTGAASSSAVEHSRLAVTPQEAIEAAAAPVGSIAPSTVSMRTEAPRRSRASAPPSRRGTASTSARRRTPPVVTEHVRTIDTIAATRVHVRPAPRPTPTSTEAGSRTAHPEMGLPAPAPTLHGEPTGVDTGGRVR